MRKEEQCSKRQRELSLSPYKIKLKGQIIPMKREESYFPSQYNTFP